MVIIWIKFVCNKLVWFKCKKGKIIDDGVAGWNKKLKIVKLALK